MGVVATVDVYSGEDVRVYAGECWYGWYELFGCDCWMAEEVECAVGWML